MSGDPDQEHFSDGVTEDIITELSRFHEFSVVARNSSFRYKGQSPKIEDVGRDLGVKYIVAGSVRKSGGRVRVTVQLIEAASATHIWAERYDRDLDDIFAIQDVVTEAVVARIAEGIKGARAIHRPIAAFALGNGLRSRVAGPSSSNSSYGRGKRSSDQSS